MSVLSILQALKCVLCGEMLDSPILLPCSHAICLSHVNNVMNSKQDRKLIRCGKCSEEHDIPQNGFYRIEALTTIIDAQIYRFNFGQVHKEASESCGKLDATLAEIQTLVKIPWVLKKNQLEEFKNTINLTRDKFLAKFNEKVDYLLRNVDDYKSRSRAYLASSDFQRENSNLIAELEEEQKRLNTWNDDLNKFKIDEANWRKIIKECNQTLPDYLFKLEALKANILSNTDDISSQIAWFKRININQLYEYKPLMSKILNSNNSYKLEQLLNGKKKIHFNHKWSLLYQASRDGFSASSFHQHCDGFAKTLTLIRTKNGNIFGAYASKKWTNRELYYHDKNAFIFSLVNMYSMPLIFSHSQDNKRSVFCGMSQGPTFGAGPDLAISSDSNTNRKSCAKVGTTYLPPIHIPNSHRFLADDTHFLVDEIEVFFKKDSSEM